MEERIQYARSEHESVAVMKQDHARQMGEIKGSKIKFIFLVAYIVATVKMLMEAEMENNERGGILGQMMSYGGMGGDFDDPRKRQARYALAD